MTETKKIKKRKKTSKGQPIRDVEKDERSDAYSLGNTAAYIKRDRQEMEQERLLTALKQEELDQTRRELRDILAEITRQQELLAKMATTPSLSPQEVGAPGGIPPMEELPAQPGGMGMMEGGPQAPPPQMGIEEGPPPPPDAFAPPPPIA